MNYRPMPLLRIPEPFDHRDWLFEVKHDGFRALAHITGHHCELRSRNGHSFKHWPQLCEELAHAVKAQDAIIDGEIVSLDKRGRSNFKNLLFRRDWPYLYAFDLLAVDGEDLRDWPLIERKRRLRNLIPSVPARLLYVDHVMARGRDFFELACAHDLDGIVAKPANARYHSDATSTNWRKMKNPQYTQATGRHERCLIATKRRKRALVLWVPEGFTTPNETASHPTLSMTPMSDSKTGRASMTMR